MENLLIHKKDISIERIQRFRKDPEVSKESGGFARVQEFRQGTGVSPGYRSFARVREFRQGTGLFLYRRLPFIGPQIGGLIIQAAVAVQIEGNLDGMGGQSGIDDRGK